MSSKLGTVIADFTTQLAAAMQVGATTATLQSATDDDGNALPSGTYFFAIDGNNSQKEHIVCTLSGTSLTSIKSVSRQGVQTSGCVRAHRVGSTVTLTDFAHLRYINDLLNGATGLDSANPLSYDGTASITSANQLATKAYVDGVAIAGAPNASSSVKGVTKLSVDPVSPTAPIAVGDNDSRMPTATQTAALVGTSGTAPSGSNKFVDNADTATSGAGKVLRLDGSGKLPPLDGSQLTNLVFTAAKKIATFTTDVTISSSVAETTLVSASIPGGTLGTANALIGRLYYNSLRVTNAKTCTLRLKYGATTVATLVLTANQTGQTDAIGGVIDFAFYAAGATSSQEGTLLFRGSESNTGNISIGTAAAGTLWETQASGTASEDSTATKTFSITAQMNNSSTLDILTVSNGYIELLS